MVCGVKCNNIAVEIVIKCPMIILNEMMDTRHDNGRVVA